MSSIEKLNTYPKHVYERNEAQTYVYASKSPRSADINWW